MNITLGERLRLLREERDWTQRQAANIFGITSGALSNYERGKRSPDIHTLKKIADVYGTSVDYLLDGKYMHVSTAVSEHPTYDPGIQDILGTECLNLIYEIGQLDEEEQKLMLLFLEGIKARKDKRSFKA